MRTSWVLVLTLAATTFGTTSARAHDPVTSPSAPAVGRHTLSASSSRFELVMKSDPLDAGKPGRVDLYLSDFDTNAPVSGAKIALDLRGESGIPAWRGEAAAVDSGIYSATFAVPRGTYSMLAAVSSAGVTDEFALPGLEVGHVDEASPRAGMRVWWPWIGGGLALVLLLVLLIARRRRATPAATAALIAILVALAPARAHEGHDRQVVTGAPVTPGAIVTMPKESQFLLGVRTQRAAIEQVQKRLAVLGRVAPRGGSELEVVAPSSGRVFFPGNGAPVIGQRIGRGAVVARLVVVDALLLRAPLGGVVTSVHVAHGQLVQPGQKILTVLDPFVVWVHGDVFESDLASIGGAKRAIITSPAYPDRVFEGRAVALGATQGEVPGAVEAWFEVPNPGGLLRIGAVVEVGIEQGRPDSSLVLPRGAVVEKDGRQLVFVHTAPEEFTAREVVITSRLGERVAVRGSVESGERVVVNGTPSLLAAPVVGMGR